MQAKRNYLTFFLIFLFRLSATGQISTENVKSFRNRIVIAIDCHKNSKQVIWKESLKNCLINQLKFDSKTDDVLIVYYGINQSQIDRLNNDKTLEKFKVEEFESKFFGGSGNLSAVGNKETIWNNKLDINQNIDKLFSKQSFFDSDFSLNNYAIPLIFDKMMGGVISEEITLILLKSSNDSIAPIQPNLLKLVNNRRNEINKSISFERQNGSELEIYKIKPKLEISVDVGKIEETIPFFLNKFTIDKLKLSGVSLTSLKKIDLSITRGNRVESYKTNLFDSDTNINQFKYDSTKGEFIAENFSFTDKALDRNSGKLFFDFKIVTELPTISSNETILFLTNFQTMTIADILWDTFTLNAIIFAIISIGLIFLLWLFARSIPQQITNHVTGFSDSFEKTDFRSFGRIKADYLAWDTKESHTTIPVSIEKHFGGKPFFKFPTKYMVRLEKVESPPNFHISIKQSENSLDEFDSSHTMVVDASGTFNFLVVVYNSDPLNISEEPELIKVQLTIVSNTLYKKLSTEINYNFFVGKDFGKIWIGFDPGTTGSCLATGNASNQIEVSDIIPSVLSFNKQKNTISECLDTYAWGNRAAQDRNDTNKNFVIFQSIKKLLGYKTKRLIEIDNGASVEKTGQELSTLLIKGLYKDFSHKYLPLFPNVQRGAVVAIPNNFTANKIQDLLDCFKDLKAIKEVRFIYEAEAVLFYYLGNYRKFFPNEVLSEETVLVFDMGGATINATIVRATDFTKNGEKNYQIDLLAKLGYGIGGDTIDFYLLKLFFPENDLNAISPIEKNGLLNFIRRMKVFICENYKVTGTTLLDKFTINDAIDKDITVNKDFWKLSCIDHLDITDIYTDDDFQKIIYANVSSIVKDLLTIAGNIDVDKVIFSGRTSFFPKIKEEVTVALKNSGKKASIIPLTLDESKVAVAKGACWYGLSKDAIVRKNRFINSTFGVRHKFNADTYQFINILDIGTSFPDDKDYLLARKAIDYTFNLDGGNVNFYQVMGVDCEKIINNDLKHKFNKLSTISIRQVAKEVGVRVSENDEVACRVIEANGKEYKEIGAINDEDITEANQEHYTWVVE